ncbi:MAG TPA: alpha/beta hydrolase [Thermoleophilaceae bacterium]|nr:alpha/beta hydrolase [Thermoleophilaceae bacterium]
MRARVMAPIAVLVCAVLAGCTLPAPSGDAPLRYRDQVFPTVGVTTDLTYGRALDAGGTPVDLKLDLYQPNGDAVARRPAYVWIHGGGFAAGDKSSGAGRASYMARLGYVVVSINYRLLSPEGCGGDRDPPPICEQAVLAAQHDAQAAVRWLRANANTYRIDPDRIAVGGSSAGAVTSLVVAWRSDDPGDSGNPGPSSRVRAAVSISGGIPTNEFIDSGDSPALFIHGTADQTVFYDWAASNAAAMYNAGVPVVLEPLEGAGHGLPSQYNQLINEQSSYFLYYFMDLANAPR